MRFARLAVLLVLWRPLTDLTGTQVCQLDSLVYGPTSSVTVHFSHCVPDEVFAQGFQ